MSVSKFSISLSPETLLQLEVLKKKYGCYSNVKRSQLISMIIFDAYSKYLTKESVTSHGFPNCKDDCSTCIDQFICDYYK